MQIKTGSFLDVYNHNSLTELVNNKLKLFWTYPKTDCSLVWALLWNTVVYTVLFLIALFAPLGILASLEALVLDYVASHLLELFAYESYLIGAIQFLQSIGGIFIVPAVIAAVAFVATSVVLLAASGAGAIICLFEVCVFIRFIFKKSSDTLTVSSLVKTRYEGIKNRFCTPIEYVDGDD
jgi:hypothetical protein